jgi:hypothetical protein
MPASRTATGVAFARAGGVGKAARGNGPGSGVPCRLARHPARVRAWARLRQALA